MNELRFMLANHKVLLGPTSSAITDTFSDFLLTLLSRLFSSTIISDSAMLSEKPLSFFFQIENYFLNSKNNMTFQFSREKVHKVHQGFSLSHVGSIDITHENVVENCTFWYLKPVTNVVYVTL